MSLCVVIGAILFLSPSPAHIILSNEHAGAMLRLSTG